jgi:hypothetical protein
MFERIAKTTHHLHHRQKLQHSPPQLFFLERQLLFEQH